MSFFQVHNRRVKFSSNGPDHLKEGAKGQAEFWCVQKPEVGEARVRRGI